MKVRKAISIMLPVAFGWMIAAAILSKSPLIQYSITPLLHMNKRIGGRAGPLPLTEDMVV
jgi:hypothetical protein